MTETWESWEVFLDLKVLIDSLKWLSFELCLVSLHLSDEIDEVFWLFEQLQLLCVNKVAKLVLNLDHELDHIKTVETVALEA